MTAARGRLRRLLARSRDRALAPLSLRLDSLEVTMSARLDDLSRRISDIEAVIETLDGRAATAAERSIASEESHTRLARRLEEIEKLLGPPPGA